MFYFSNPDRVKKRIGLNGYKAVGLNDLKDEDKSKLGVFVEWNGSYWVNSSGQILLWIPDAEKVQRDKEKEAKTEELTKAIDEKSSKELKHRK